ncbi:TPA: hypothetical protein ACHSNL_001854 [Klebsiella variicola]
MAFISQLAPQQRRNGRTPGTKFISFRKTSSGATGGLVTADTGLRGGKIDIQIDAETKTLRVGRCDSGVKVSSQQGTFSCSICVFNTVGKCRISLTDGGDGWWYGNYCGLESD